MAYTPKCKKTKYILSLWNFSLFGWLVGLMGYCFSSSKMLGQVPLTLVLLSNQV